MSEPTLDKSDAHEALDGLVDITFEALRGNARHASRLFSESINEDVTPNLGREIADFWNRVGQDTARAFKAGQEFLDRLGSAGPSPQASSIPNTGPAGAAGGAAATVAVATCRDDQLVGPFRTPGAIQAQALRRRGDVAPSITSDRITMTPASVTRNPTKLQIQVKCGGVARGIYEGKLMIGTDEYSYNIYLDPA